MQGCPRTAACYGAAVKLAARYSRRGGQKYEYFNNVVVLREVREYSVKTSTAVR